MLRRVAALIAIGTGAILGAGTIIAYAQNSDAITQRRAAMTNIAKAGTPPFKMSKGEEPFDLAKVQAGLKTYQGEGGQVERPVPGQLKNRRYRRVPEDLECAGRVQRCHRYLHCDGQDSGGSDQG